MPAITTMGKGKVPIRLRLWSQVPLEELRHPAQLELVRRAPERMRLPFVEVHRDLLPSRLQSCAQVVGTTIAGWFRSVAGRSATSHPGEAHVVCSIRTLVRSRIVEMGLRLLG